MSQPILLNEAQMRHSSRMAILYSKPIFQPIFMLP